MDADKCSAVSADIVLIGAELAALSCDALQLLLSRSVGISNLHDETFVTQSLHTVIFANDFVTDVTSLKASETDTAAVAHRVSENLARENGIAQEYSAQGLKKDVSYSHGNIRFEVSSTYSLIKVLGKIGDVEIGRTLITLSLKSRVEALLLHRQF